MTAAASPHRILQIPHSQNKTLETPVGVFTRSQNWRTDDPAYYISVLEARRWRKTGQWYSVNAGKDIAEAGQVKIEVPEERQKMGWKPIPSGTLAIGFVDVLQLV